MDNLLSLLETVLFRVEGEDITPLNTPAHVLWSDLVSPEKWQQDLFGVDSPAALSELLRSGDSPSIELTGKSQRWRLKWEFCELPENPSTFMVQGMSWLPVVNLLDKLSKESLIYREMVINLVPSFLIEQVLRKKVLQPKAYPNCTIGFADVVSFSRIASELDPVTLIRKLDLYFSMFDQVAKSFGLEKIKTIGDAYMVVSGIPHRRLAHAVDGCLAALHMLEAVARHRSKRRSPRGPSSLDVDNWSFRMGMHSGPCISGVLGSAKYLFDIWGDSVNIAARMEGVSQPGRLAVSGTTYELIKDRFDCIALGQKTVKNIGDVEVYLVNRLRPEYSGDDHGLRPNAAFLSRYKEEFFPGIESPQEHLSPYYRALLKA